MRYTNDEAWCVCICRCLPFATVLFYGDADRDGEAMRRCDAIETEGALVLSVNRRTKMLVRRPKQSFEIIVDMVRENLPT